MAFKKTPVDADSVWIVDDSDGSVKAICSADDSEFVCHAMNLAHSIESQTGKKIGDFCYIKAKVMPADIKPEGVKVH